MGKTMGKDIERLGREVRRGGEREEEGRGWDVSTKMKPSSFVIKHNKNSLKNSSSWEQKRLGYVLLFNCVSMYTLDVLYS